MQKILANLSLKRKLQLLTFLPLFGLFLFITNMLKTSYEDVIAMDRLTQIVHVTEDVSGLIKNQEKERSLTARFINSHGESFEKELFKVRDITDKYYLQTLQDIKLSDVDLTIKEKFIKVMSTVKTTLDKVRLQITKENIDNTKTTNALNFYTSINNDILAVLLDLSHYSDTSNITTQIISLYNLLATKDDVELIRSYGVNLINELESEEDDRDKNILYNQIKIKSLLGTSAQKLNVYLKIANEFNLNFYNETIKKIKFDEYNEYVRALANDADLDLYEGEGDTFYALANKTITIYDTFENKATHYLDNNISELKNNAKLLFISNLILGTLLFMFTLALGFLIFKKISNDMQLLKTNLLDFFDFIAKKKDDIQLSNVQGSDEFALLINTINSEVEKAKIITEKDNKVLIEIDEVISRVENGFFTYNVSKEAGSQAVSLLKSNVNNMINTTKEKLDTLQLILEAYGKYDYQFRLDDEKRKGMAGNIGTLSTSLLALGEDISIFMATFSNIVDQLNTDTHTLMSTSSALSDSSNIQAASLEESAAAIEEVTISIQENTSNIHKMSAISDELKEKTDKGNILASDTSSAMNEIVTKINQINESISVIDQISFQTNILSLNAAVEAATAGEAGKGFAVVAGEVRNLASRSAEAAKEIKDLVESAISQASTGNHVVNDMIEGYSSLSKQIIETKEIIDTVSANSNEQRDKIIQINDSVSKLDTMTQQNAQEANNLNGISSKVEELSSNIESTINKASFDHEFKSMVCDVNFAGTIASYKRDHIKFKSSNFEKLNEFTKFEVVDCKNCRLGKWILEQESKGEKFTKTSGWNDLKGVHERVHADVQYYINENANHTPQSQLAQKAIDIEDDTLEVFNQLNQILKMNCKV